MNETFHQKEFEVGFKNLFELGPDALFVIDNETLAIVEANSRAQQMYGYSCQEFKTLRSTNLSAEPEKTAKALADRQTDISLRYHRHKDGHVFPVEIIAVFLQWKGRPVHFVSIRDISTKMQAELALKAQNQELEKFTYTVSHDLKSPLITIKGFLQFLLRDARNQDWAKLDNDIKRIGDAANKMHNLLDDLLNLSRIGRVVNPATTFAMKDLITEVCELLTGSIREKNVQIEIDDNMPEVTADRIRLREVWQNLIENAIKFSSPNRRPYIKIGFNLFDKEKHFYVQDNGIGVDPNYQNKIFDLFNKLDKTVEGTGIGLALVKRIIEIHGGRLWMQSKGIDQGSTFFISLKDSSMAPEA